MKSLSITLYLSEILYDIRNKAFLTGRSRETADNQAQISWSQLSGDEPEMGQIMRSVESALAVVQTKLAPYLEEITRERILREHHPPRHRRPHPAEPIELPAEDDVLMPSEEHAITLQLLMPDNYNQAFVPALSSSIHNFIVAAVLGEWFVISYPNEAKAYLQWAEGESANIKACLEKRIKPIRRRLHPF